MATSTYNVTTDFGANNLVGDGSTDNTSKLNAILAGSSTPALTAPYVLFFPIGTYVLASTVATTVPSGVAFVGEMKPTAATTATAQRGAQIKFTRSTRTTDNGIIVGSNTTFRDIGFVSTNDANAVYWGCVLGSGVTGVVFERCLFYGAYTGCLRAQNTAQCFATQCEFAACSGDITGSMVSGCFVESSFVNCWFHDNAGTQTTNHCFYSSTNVTTTPHGNTVTGCVFQNFVGGGALVFKGGAYYGYNNTIVGNTFETNTACTSVTLVDMVGCAVSGNTISGKAGGITVLDASNMLVSDNVMTFQQSGSGMISFQGVTNSRIAGNLMQYDPGIGTATLSPVWTFATGIELDPGSLLTIENNRFTGVMRCVVLENFGAGNSDVTIRNNEFIIPAGASEVGSGYYYNNPSTSYGVVFDGAATRVRLIDNLCSGLNYEVYCTNSVSHGLTPGTPNLVKFRSSSWVAPVTSVIGIQTVTATPTNFTQLTEAGSSVPPAAVGKVFTGISY